LLTNVHQNNYKENLMKYDHSLAGINLRRAYEIAYALGCSISPVRRTGEDRISHPLLDHTVRVNSRRKDAPRHLVVFLRRIAELRGRAA
jgi:hypothetical protein